MLLRKSLERQNTFTSIVKDLLLSGPMWFKTMLFKDQLCFILVFSHILFFTHMR